MSVIADTKLIAPHGGTLVDRTGDRPDDVETLQVVTLTSRELVENWGTFVELHIATSVDECARRDVKGLYEKAFKGEIKGFTGVDDPYEDPVNPDVRIDTEQHEPEESAQLILQHLEERGLIPAGVTA